MKWSELNIKKFWFGYIYYVICVICVLIFLSVVSVVGGIYYTILEILGERELHDK